MRAKNLRTCYDRPSTGWDRSKQKQWDSELKQYRNARAEGIQPRTTKSADISAAVKISDKVGQAFQA